MSADHLVYNLVLQSFHKLYQLNKDFVAPHKNNSNQKTFYKNQKTKSYPHRKIRSLKHTFYSDISHLLMLSYQRVRMYVVYHNENHL